MILPSASLLQGIWKGTKMKCNNRHATLIEGELLNNKVLVSIAFNSTVQNLQRLR